jgi:hypothetical protein
MLDGVWSWSRLPKRRFSMLKTRVLSVLALVAALSLAPFAEASAADLQKSPGGSLGLVEYLEAGIDSIWESIAAVWTDVGPRMDENG